MRLLHFLYCISAFLLFSGSACNRESVLIAGFYNVENLFDTVDDPETIDEEFLPSSEKKWTEERYQTKLHQLSRVIDSFDGATAPHILGLCEVENRKVLEDLCATELLKPHGYQIVHVNSRDARGIDNALLYQPGAYRLLDFGTQTVDLSDLDDTTRDILWTLGLLPNGDTLICLVNHWPSRRSGKAESEPKRIRAASALSQLIQELEQRHPEAGILCMGDFNDEPTDSSVQRILGAGPNTSTDPPAMVNLMWELDAAGMGSYRFRDAWNMLDQLMVNRKLLDGRRTEVLPGSTRIKDDPFLRQTDPKYLGHPFRTYGGHKYLGGFSDHFPVYTRIGIAK